jgi:hypothetical protein
MTFYPTITIPPAVDTMARELAEQDAAQRSNVDTGTLQDCVDRHDQQTQPFTLNLSENGVTCGIGLRIDPDQAKYATTRLKMTLHSVTPLETSADDPLTRCTFGAVYSPNPTEEDGVYGKYTPYGQLTYNVRSDIAANLIQGRAYYIDICLADL